MTKEQRQAIIRFQHAIGPFDDFELDGPAVRIKWDKIWWRISQLGGVEEVNGGMLTTTRCATLIEKLLKTGA